MTFSFVSEHSLYIDERKAWFNLLCNNKSMQISKRNLSITIVTSMQSCNDRLHHVNFDLVLNGSPVEFVVEMKKIRMIYSVG